MAYPHYFHKSAKGPSIFVSTKLLFLGTFVSLKQHVGIYYPRDPLLFSYVAIYVMRCNLKSVYRVKVREAKQMNDKVDHAKQR